MHYDPYDTTATSIAFRAARGATLAETFTVRSDGRTFVGERLGIGTTSPTEELTISSSTPAVKLEDTDQANSYVQFSAANGDLFLSANGASSQGQFILRSGNGGSVTERMRIDSSGRVGIGHDTPGSFSSGAHTLVLNTNSGNCGLTISTGAADQTGSIFFAEGTSSAGDGRIRYEHANNAMVFSTDNSERMRVDSSGAITCIKPVKTIQNTVVTDTTGVRFEIPLPSTSRMFRITGSFKFDGTGSGATYRIWGDFGNWSDSHSPSLEGFANFWVNGASGDLEQDVTSGRYFEVADPVDPSNCEVTYDILVTTQAFNGSNSGQRPGVSGNISWTYSQIGRAWTVFSYQDINASGTDRLTTWAWDIDAVPGSHGTGTHQYVIEEYPLTAQ
jgi:hypothetical protein